MTPQHGITLESPVASSPPRDRKARLEHLGSVIDHASHWLPAQGPITVFIHHNTLHALEDLSFDDAVKRGARLFGCHPYLTEGDYREKLAAGRIRPADLEAVLRRDLGIAADNPIRPLGSRLSLRMAMLEHPLCLGPGSELRWFVAETDALSRFRPEASAAARERLLGNTQRWIMRQVRSKPPKSDGSASGWVPAADPLLRQRLADLLRQFGEGSIEHWSPRTWESFSLQALWRVCKEGVHGLRPPPPTPSEAIRHRDLLLEATGHDSDSLVHPVLIRFCAPFLDQGFAHWPLPYRALGFFKAFSTLYRQQAGPPDLWLQDLPRELGRLADEAVTPRESILESLEMLGVPESEWDRYLSATILSLRGWAGMVRQIEIRGDRVSRPIPEESTVDFLAVQLVLERLALSHLARRSLGFSGELSDLRDAARRHLSRHPPPSVEQRAFLVFQIAQVLGWSPDDLHRLAWDDWQSLVDEIEGFSGLERRRVFHAAFERRYRTQTLDALVVHNRNPAPRRQSPAFQVIVCLDEREESLRRHLEEVAPEVETFGAAGFFSVPIYYQGVADANFVPLCPVVIRPQHWVTERSVYTLEMTNRRRAVTRRALGRASHQMQQGSRRFASGTLLAAGLGVLASVPLVARILFPRLTAQIRRAFGNLVAPPRMTQLQLERSDPIPGPEGRGVGFSVDEMANCAERLLRDIGLTSGISRLVLLLGHGSNSLNNPHNSAYNCGACGGGSGGPNARSMAQMLNDPRIRERLAQRGLPIPDGTAFVGGMHNTCSDLVTFFDLDRLPPSLFDEFDSAVEALEEACDRNAHERCRRFQSAPLDLTFRAARRHVEERAEDLAQTRPECGHATNAVCVVGRRQRTRGLFMDRRTFLVSYDPAQDDRDSAILTRILQAVFPVCAGINLEYYFSYVDSPGWGCGSKLPHNVTSLLGVMDGAASDLRTGLPWQMVEIHEPVRLLFVIETTAARMEAILEKNPAIAQLCRNGWIQLTVLDPDAPEIQVFDRGQFRPYEPVGMRLPRVGRSVDWYRGCRDHLEYAEVTG